MQSVGGGKLLFQMRMHGRFGYGTMLAMQPVTGPLLPRYVRWGLLVGVAVALSLVLTGQVLVPTASIWSTLAAMVTLLAYGVAAAIFPLRLYRSQPDVLRVSTVFGLLAGGVFCAEMILEYAFTPARNRSWGLVEFGAVFLLYFAAGLVCVFRTRNFKAAVATSVASAFIASLVWVITLLVVLYAFRGSARQELVLRTEGEYEDFVRSGMSDFSAFLMEDLMGATVFHLSLGLVVAAVLGAIGGLVGKVVLRLRKR